MAGTPPCSREPGRPSSQLPQPAQPGAVQGQARPGKGGAAGLTSSPLPGERGRRSAGPERRFPSAGAAGAAREPPPGAAGKQVSARLGRVSGCGGQGDPGAQPPASARTPAGPDQPHPRGTRPGLPPSCPTFTWPPLAPGTRKQGGKALRESGRLFCRQGAGAGRPSVCLGLKSLAQPACLSLTAGTASPSLPTSCPAPLMVFVTGVRQEHGFI